MRLGLTLRSELSACVFVLIYELLLVRADNMAAQTKTRPMRNYNV